MTRWSLMTLGMALLSFASAKTGEVPFTSAGIPSIQGRNICQFQGKFYEGVGVFLDGKKEYSVQYLVRDGVEAVFLLGRPLTEHGNCGTVISFFDVTPLIEEDESVEFKCYTNDGEGGTTWKRWGHIIAIANNHRGKLRYVTARLAWRLNLKEKRFEEIHDKTVRCDTAGYEY